MNFVRKPPAITWQAVASLGFILLALFLATHCKAPLPDEPPITVVDLGDAAALLDVGADASPIARACAVFASQTPPCREAVYTCVDAIDRMRAKLLISDITIGCVVGAHDRPGIQACGALCP